MSRYSKVEHTEDFEDLLNFYKLNGLGENIMSSTKKEEEQVLHFILDCNVASKAHRKNIFNQSFNVIGIGFDRHRRSDKPNLYYISENFGKNSKLVRPKTPTILKKPI